MKKWLLACFAVALVLLGGGALLYRELKLSYRGYSNTTLIEIEPGTRAGEIAARLAERGVLAHRTPFLALYALGRARHRSLKAGEYFFDRPLAPLDVYRKLVQGDVYLHAIVIPEGSDRFDMAEIFHREIGADPSAFLRVTSQPSAVYDLDLQARSLEGYLFPDTYRFPRGASPAAIAQTMLARFRRVLGASLPAELRQSPARLHQTLTLASLVEKETPAPAERPMIAGVFERRLAAGMPLQCDPTIVYAARLDGQSAGKGPITQSQLDLASPYNTYRRTGLPPGPICSPGAASIEAALHPAPGHALYFVSNNHGGHVFASTLAEHQRNVARYR
ncbi:MAG TPA: endolytic transglycosylase MltG, partial [Terriglobia bacterium]|nr:endolytic transglycosylase MltG [Terriglobia bacterium]